jgi:hypothetical protein
MHKKIKIGEGFCLILYMIRILIDIHHSNIKTINRQYRKEGGKI